MIARLQWAESLAALAEVYRADGMGGWAAWQRAADAVRPAGAVDVPERRRRTVSAPTPLSGRQAEVLAYLVEHGSSTATQIAGALIPGSYTGNRRVRQALRMLAERGLVTSDSPEPPGVKTWSPL